MLTFGVVVLGVTDRDRAADFWCQALGYERQDHPFGGWDVTLVPGDHLLGAVIALQTSATPPHSHPRLHLDLHVGSSREQEMEAERLVALGAERVEWDSYPDDPDFVVLADPEGNRFCIVDLSHEPG